MRSHILVAALAVVVAACDTDPTAPRIPAQLPSQPFVSSNSYVAAFTHTVLPFLPNVQANLAATSSSGINENGSIAGTTEGQFDGHFFTVPRATLWTVAGPQDLGVLPPGSASQRSYATDVNDGETVTGWGTTHYSTGVCCGLVRGFRWTAAGGMKPLMPLVASDNATTRGYAINVMGNVAGVIDDGAGATYATVWFDPDSPPYVIAAAGNSASANDINDVGQVVGVNANGPFVWSAQDGLTVIPGLGGSWKRATAINNLGVVVGFSEIADGTIHPFRWTAAGGIQDLGLPPGATNAYARAVSKSGQIVVDGEMYDAATGDITNRLFLWADGQWIDLGADLGSSYAVDINEKLQIAGSGIVASASYPRAIRWDVTLTEATAAFTFDGFFAPIQNLPVVNRVKAGQAIPVKFSLGGDQGLSIFAPGYPASQQIACDGNAPVDDVEATVTAGGSSLSYDPVTGRYTYVWKTSASWAGTCRSLTLRLTDGSEHTAHFRFVR